MCVDVFFFFFQAEDGIRDLVRSRGLGDVYKRQVISDRAGATAFQDPSVRLQQSRIELDMALQSFTAVSYTHLTLPTSDLV